MLSAAVLGRPIAHSKSPLLHAAAFHALGLTSAEYGRFDLGAEDLDSFLATHQRQIGFSMTMPLKERLVELALTHGWELDDTAGLTGVANTLIRRDGSTLVSNTDVQGIVRALTPGLNTAVRDGAGRATILGAGATAASALLACRELGISTVEFLVRNPDRARKVLALSQRLGIAATTAPLTMIEPSALVISTLPAEAVPDVRWSPAFHGGVALDVAYASESTFLRAAESHGLIPVEGTAMLVEQAVVQSEMFIAAAGAAGAAAAAGESSEIGNHSVIRTSGDISDVISAAMYRALEVSPDPTVT